MTPHLPPVTISEADGVRYLHLDSPWVQGAMRIAEPRRIELDYVQRMLAALLWVDEAALDAETIAVQLGLGASAITRFTLRELKLRTIAVELNPQVIAACRTWFRLPDDGPRLQVVQADAGRWVREARLDAPVRLLHVDLYDHEAAAPVLDDADFYAACRSLLAEGGVMSVNLFGREHRFERSAGTIAGVFGPDQVWSLRPTREGNTALIAGRGVAVPERAVLAERAANIERRFGALGLPARKWLRMVRPWRPA